MKNTLIFLNSRVIKLFANIIKMACYVFHFLFPNKRFTLPQHSPPLFKSRNKSEIPHTLWQTNYTDHVTIAIYINYLFNRLMSYDFEYRFMSTEDREKFIKKKCSLEAFEAYSRIQIGAAQADLWRLLVLNEYGGVYMDIDAHLVWSLSSIMKTDQQELYLTLKNGEISNYFIASKANNINLTEMINLILKNIEHNTIKNVYELTGPKVFNQTLDANKVNTSSYKVTCNQGNFTNHFFQYIDKAEGKWTTEQKVKDIIK